MPFPRMSPLGEPLPEMGEVLVVVVDTLTKPCPALGEEAGAAGHVAAFVWDASVEASAQDMQMVEAVDGMYGRW